MKNFLKYLLASIIGTLLVALIMFFVFIGSISALIAKQEKSFETKNNSIFALKLDKPIKDRKPSFPFHISPFGRGNSMTEPVLGLNEILDNIEKAKTDDKIKGIYLELSEIQAGIATIKEIRDAILDFKESGKFVISYSDAYNQTSYYLASASDKIYMNREGLLYLTGMRAQLVFFKELFEKWGFQPHVVRHGKFKSAVEPFINKEMSEENRQQIKTYMGSIWNHIVNEICEMRNIEPGKLNLLADNLKLWDAEETVKNNLIDSLLYKDEVLEVLKEKSGRVGKKKLNFVTLTEYDRVPKPRPYKGLAKQKIAVIYASGEIVSGDAYEDQIGAHKISRTIREARQDSSIKAIVFRVNSGGGGALASELIWRELDLARKEKPVIASMGDVSASGGYYIVAPADTIVASPVTITGSIGVFALLMNAKSFFNKKLGITSDVEKTNKYSDFGSLFRPVSPFETSVIQKKIDHTYNSFVSKVADGRGLSYQQVDEIGEGRVWSGINAKEIGLIDVYGGLTKAIDIAAEKTGLEKYRIVELPEQEDPLQQILKEFTGNIKHNLIRKELGDDYKYYEIMKSVKNLNGIQTRLPFMIDLY